MPGPASFSFLNERREVRGPEDWNKPEWDKLWLYNLHYFDDLNAEGAEERCGWHLGLVKRWMAENAPGRGNGWEPYPLSLRVVNWIKWVLGGGEADGEMLHSLAVQVRYLAKRIEYHILGNHLMANAKALVFAGLFFEGDEAEGWLEKGLGILDRQVPEQVLPDGGHFERSPMYHTIILEDLLDLINVSGVFEDGLPRKWKDLPRRWREAVQRMRAWLQTMCHPDLTVRLTGPRMAEIILPNSRRISYRATGGALKIAPTTYHPQFGVSIPTQCIELTFKNPQITQIFTDLNA